MWLITGLGNPGSKYRWTRHNVGFMAIDCYAGSIGHPPEKKEHKALTYHFQLEGQKVVLAKPQTFMNNSGESVQAISHFYKIAVENICVVHDEVDLPFGFIKVQFDRGHGGNNGIRDIHDKLSAKNYYRIKVGVGKADGKKDTAAHVLSNFNDKENEKLPAILEKICDAIESLVVDGFQKTATLINGEVQ